MDGEDPGEGRSDNHHRRFDLTPHPPQDEHFTPPKKNRHTILLYAQDGKGMGHITRSLTIAKRLLEANRNSIAYMVSESPLIDDLPLPTRCSYIKLPTHLASLPLPNTQEEDEA